MKLVNSRLNYLFIFLILFLFLFINEGYAASTTLFSTSFVGCSSDVNYSSDGWACGTSPANILYNNTNAGVCTSSGYQQVSLAANYPGGGGGRGWRRYVCGGPNGSVSPATGSLMLNIPNHVSEFWLRFYTRWETGYAWDNAAATGFPAGLDFQKVLYIRPLSGNSGAVMDLTHADGMNMSAQDGQGRTGSTTFAANCSACGWNTLNPNGTSGTYGANHGDNSWHAIEIHIKDQSGSGTRDGVWELWIDGVLKSSQNDINWSTGSPVGISSIQFMINHISTSHTTPKYNDIDDIAISTTGYIGLVNSTLPATPNPPANVR